MIVDNYAETLRQLAQTVLDSPLAGLLRESDAEQLRRCASGEDSHFYGLEFRRDATGFEKEKYPPRCECTLYVNLESDYARVEDENGDIYVKYRVFAAVSWASWGSTGTWLAQQRLRLMDEVCSLAEEIDLHFAGRVVYQLWNTKAEIEENSRKSEEAKRLWFYTERVTSNARRMLVGQSRVVALPGHVGQWEGKVQWPRPNGDVWQFIVKVNDAHCIFVRTENGQK